LIATSIPMQLPWPPLMVPVTVLTIYAIATRPVQSDQGTSTS
jgi:hypothetical protein